MKGIKRALSQNYIRIPVNSAECRWDEAQSTYIYRAPQCMSPRWNWDSPTPLAASECALPPGPKGGGVHSPAAKGVGESQFQRLEKRLALCLLCGMKLHGEKYFRDFVPFN